MKRSKKQLQTGESRSDTPLWRRVAPAVAAPVSGALLALCFPPFNFHFLAWIALVPVLYAMRRASRRGALALGYLFIMCYLSMLLWWLAIVQYPAIIAYIIFTVLLPLVFLPWVVAVNRFAARLPGVAAAAGASAVWILFEWMFSNGQFAFPWFVIGNTQIKSVVPVQAAALGGVYLVSFEVLMVNFFVTSLLEKRVGGGKRGWIVAGAIFAALLVYGIVSVPRGVPSEPGISVATIQANYPYELKEAGVVQAEVHGTHITMTAEATLEGKPDIVVWSESVAYMKWLTGPMYLDSMKRMLETLDVSLVAGAYEYSEEGTFHNAVTAFDPGSDPLGKYRKMQTVPFGEVFPYRKTIEKISPSAGEWISENVHEIDVTAGTEYTVFESRHGKFAAMVCFDSVIPSIPRRLVLNGAEYMFVLTNDSWSPSPVGLYQHAMQGAMRAVENRRYLVQATNNGQSDIIDPWGREVAVAPVNEAATMRGEVWPMKRLTLYTRFGDWFCILCAVIAVVSIVSVRRNKEDD